MIAHTNVYVLSIFFFLKQKTAYEMRISDWSSDVCSSDLDGSARDDLPHRLPRGDRAAGLRGIAGTRLLQSAAAADPPYRARHHRPRFDRIARRRSLDPPLSADLQ